MSLQHPVVTMNTLYAMFPNLKQDTHSLLKQGMMFYSVQERQFLTYLPQYNVSVSDSPHPHFAVASEDVIVEMRRLGAVFEVSGGVGMFPSELLLASNFVERMEEHVDVNDSTYVAVFENNLTPIIIGSKPALERLLLPVEARDYFLTPLLQIITKG